MQPPAWTSCGIGMINNEFIDDAVMVRLHCHHQSALLLHPVAGSLTLQDVWTPACPAAAGPSAWKYFVTVNLSRCTRAPARAPRRSDLPRLRVALVSSSSRSVVERRSCGPTRKGGRNTVNLSVRRLRTVANFVKPLINLLHVTRLRCFLVNHRA